MSVSAISELKAAIAMETAIDPLMERVLESSNDALRDSILDDIQFSVLGAENDSSLNSIISKIPEFDDTDKATERQINALTESLDPTELI